MAAVILVGLLLLITSGTATSGSAKRASHADALDDTFEESLEVALLTGNHALISLETRQSTWLGRSPTTFPQAVRRLAAGAPLSHLTLALTRGRWDYRSWGLPRVPAYPPGAEVAVRWARPELHATQWTRLQHRLSGMMCSSLNLLQSPHTAPLDPMRGPATCCPHGANGSCLVEPDTGHSGWHVGSLPREAVCTENLSPWLQLLPCRGQAGLAALLADRQHILAGAYHSLNLEVQVVPASPAEAAVSPAGLPVPPHLLLIQRFTAVLRLKPPARAASQSPGQGVPFTWVLPTASKTQPCSAARSSQLITWAPSAQPDLIQAGSHDKQDSENETKSNGQDKQDGGKDKDGGLESASGTSLRSIDRELMDVDVSSCGVRQQQALRADVSRVLSQLVLSPPQQQPCLPPALLLTAALLGTGLHTGQLQLVITQVAADRVAPAAAWPEHPARYMMGGNDSATQPTHEGGAVCVQLTIPWVMRLWLHTLQVQMDGQVVSASSLHVSTSVEPARDRGRAAGVVLCLTLPRTARHVALRWRISRGFLSLEEHPPDAHRGADIPPARLHYMDTLACDMVAASPTDESRGGTCNGVFTQVLGPGLLLRLATADVAMPYNVICLTSTVLAVFLGATINTLLQRSPGSKKNDVKNDVIQSTKQT